MSGNAQFRFLLASFCIALFLCGCGGGQVFRNFKAEVETNFSGMRASLPAKHLKIYVLPVVDLRTDKTHAILTETAHPIWGTVIFKHSADASPVEIINEKLTDYFNSLGIFWVEKTKAHAFLKLSLKKFQSNLNVYPFQNPGNVIDSEVEFDIEIIRAKGGGSLFNKTLKGLAQINNKTFSLREKPPIVSYPMAFGIAIQKAMKRIRVDELEEVAIKLDPSLAEEKRQQQAQIEKEQLPQSGTGSGFFVSKMGHVITNAHVVKNCKKVTIGNNANKQVPAELINTDRSNDLALLKLSTLKMVSTESQSLIQKLSVVAVPLATNGLLRNEDVRLGEKVLVAGYPFGDVFSNTIKVTSGIVSAIRGAGDDSGQFQLDAAVQPGNSGGPIYDSRGNIVGVVVAQLDKLKMAKAIGSMPENVNFGIKASTARQYLTSRGLPVKKSEGTEEKSTEQLAEIAQNQALMVMCFQ